MASPFPLIGDVMNRIRLFIIILSLALSTLPGLAQSDAEHLLEAVFQSFDENHDGAITLDEANHFIDKSFAEMDPGKTGRISFDAWMNFSFGLADLAADQGRSDAYNRAKARIFKRWHGARATGLTLEDFRAGVLGDTKKGLGAKAKGSDLRIDFAAFKRAPFVRQLMGALH